MFFSPNYILQHRSVLKYQQTRLCLGTFEYIEADSENGLQNPNNIPQHYMREFLIILHIV
jgi:hypothetical protein